MRVATAATVCFPMAICVYYVEVAAAVVVAFAICFATDTRYNIQDTNMWGGEWEWEYWCLVLGIFVQVYGDKRCHLPFASRHLPFCSQLMTCSIQKS